MKHNQFQQCLDIVNLNIPLHLTGETGSGKSTIAYDIAKALNLPVSILPCTRQTSTGDLTGFNSVNAVYVSTPFREAVEHGHVFILEELTAVDNNIILVINSLDNGVMQFKDKLIPVHPNFRLIATSNPVTEAYGARSKLDASTENRYLTVTFDEDPALVKHIASTEAVTEIAQLTELFQANGISRLLTQRDTKRLAQLKESNLFPNPLALIYDAESPEFKLTAQAHFDNLANQSEAEAAKQAEDEAFQRKSQHDMTDFNYFVHKVQQENNYEEPPF